MCVKRHFFRVLRALPVMYVRMYGITFTVKAAQPLCLHCYVCVHVCVYACLCIYIRTYVYIHTCACASAGGEPGSMRHSTITSIHIL